MKKKLLSLLLLIFPLFVTSGVQAADTIKIVSDTAYAPFEFKDSDQVYKGIDVDIIKAVAEKQGWNYEQSYPGFDAAVNAVQAGQADAIMAGMTATEERKKVFTMSDTYYDTKVVIATLKGKGITDYSQLKGKTVGVKNGTAAQRFLDNNKDKYGYEIKTFDTGDLMNNSLQAGAVDAIMDDKPVLQYAVDQGQNLEINMDGEAVGSFAFGVKKGSDKEDGSLEQIIQTWTGGSSNSVAANIPETTTAAGQQATPVKSEYKIVSDSSFAPFVFQNDSNEYTGIDMELIQAIAKDQGFTVSVTNPGFDAAVNAVQAGQADGIEAGMSITDERKKTFDFSDPYYIANAIIGVKKNSTIASYEDLKGKTVGVKNGTASHDFLTENKDKYGYNIKVFSEAASMYDSLNTGSVEAIMDDEPIIKYAINQGQDLATPIVGIPVGEYGFAVKKGTNPELIEMFNNGLANLKENGEYEKLLNKYLGASTTSNNQSSNVDETSIWGLLQNNYKQLLNGLWITISLTLISFAIAMVIGIIFGMFSVSPVPALRTAATIFVDVVRGIPLMILAAFIFWGIPNLIESMTGQQSPINDFVAGVIALSLNSGAYIAEIVRGGIQAVPAGQMEASRSLGISYSKTMRKIILPQAILAVIYLILITSLTRLAKHLEKRTSK